MWENDRLWFSGNTGCVPAGDSLIRSCARIVELSTATRTVTTDSDLSQRGAHLFYPAIRPDGSGDLVVVYGESGLSVLPEVVAVGRTPDGTFTNPVVIAQSASAYLGDRYGDYFGAARDPANPGLVWVAGQAGTDVLGGRGWATTVASVAITAPGAQPPPVIGARPPAVRAVHATGRSGKAVRLAFRSLDDGAGVRTVVTVRSKRAVVFKLTTAQGVTARRPALFRALAPRQEVARHVSVLRALRVFERRAVGAELLDRHAPLRSARSCAACAGAVGASSWRK